jgi:ATP-dependent RNA helicase RhlB
LILVPTRELAVQVESDALKLGKYLPYRVLSIFGGVGYEKQETALKEGVDIIVATPGRFIDLYKNKKIELGSIQVFVADEADRMFDMGFYPDIRYILGKLPKQPHRQTMIFSATLEERVRRLSEAYMVDPELIEIDPEQVTVESIEQRIFHVSNEEKLPLLLGLLTRERMERVIIFTNMKVTAEEVAFKLNHNGFPSEVITGDLDQKKRLRIIEKMKEGKIHILVATDVAARGLHIEGVSHVINYDLPEEAASYVHRIGRTARLGTPGKAYSLACEKWVLNLLEIERFIEHKIETAWVDEVDLVPDKAGAFRRRDRRPWEDRERKFDRARPGQRDNGARRSGSGRRSSPDRVPPPAEKKPEPMEKKSEQTEKKPEHKVSPFGDVRKPMTPAPHPTHPKRGERPKSEEKRGEGQNGRRPRRSRSPVPEPVEVRGEIPHLHQRRERRRPIQFSTDVTPSAMPRPELDRLEYYKWKYGESFSIKKEKPGKKERERKPEKGKAAQAPAPPRGKKEPPPPPKEKKPTLLSKILRVFGGK